MASLDFERYEFRANQIWPSTVNRRLSRLQHFQEFMKKNGFDATNIKALDYYLDELTKTMDNAGSIAVYFYDVLSYYEVMLISLEPMHLKQIKRRLPRVLQKEPDFLTRDEVVALFKVVSDNLTYTLIYHLLYHYCRRTGEVLQSAASPGLCWEDMDSTTVTFYILKKKIGLTQASYELLPQTSVMLKDIRPKKMGKTVEREIIDERGSQRVQSVTPVFKLSQRAVEIAFKKHCEVAGIKPDGGGQVGRRLVPHLLRHSYITHQGEDDVPIEFVSKKMAQHSSIEITASAYRGFSKGEERRRRGFDRTR